MHWRYIAETEDSSRKRVMWWLLELLATQRDDDRIITMIDLVIMDMMAIWYQNPSRVATKYHHYIIGPLSPPPGRSYKLTAATSPGWRIKSKRPSNTTHILGRILLLLLSLPTPPVYGLELHLKIHTIPIVPQDWLWHWAQAKARCQPIILIPL